MTTKRGGKRPCAKMVMEMLKKNAPSKMNQLKYMARWITFPITHVDCSHYTIRGCRGVKRMTDHGAYCSRHYCETPRCSVENCDVPAVTDPRINPDMLCRDHLFDDSDLAGVEIPAIQSSAGWV